MYNKVLLKDIRVHLTAFEQLTYQLDIFNDKTDLTNSITLFMLILLHTVSKIGMYRLLYIPIHLITDLFLKKD